jgi:shikimate dehydrogenase
MDKYGIIGYPLAHTFSPKIHNSAFKELAINARYEVYQIEPDSFEEEVAALKKSEIKGFNVTVPYKKRILPFIDIIDPLAKKVQAVNTVQKKGNKWFGYNTDLWGFTLPVTDKIRNFKDILVIGSGGAAYGICFALLEYDHIQSMYILNRSPENAQLLKNSLVNYYNTPVITEDLNYTPEIKFDLIVNTTNVGMGKLKNENPFDFTNNIHPQSFIYDLIYNPEKTKFLQLAAENNLEYINGLEMLIGQARKSFQIWTGREYPGNIIDKNIFY